MKRLLLGLLLCIPAFLASTQEITAQTCSDTNWTYCWQQFRCAKPVPWVPGKCESIGNTCETFSCSIQTGGTCGWTAWTSDSVCLEIGGQCQIGSGAPAGGLCGGDGGDQDPDPDDDVVAPGSNGCGWCTTQAECTAKGGAGSPTPYCSTPGAPFECCINSGGGGGVVITKPDCDACQKGVTCCTQHTNHCTIDTCENGQDVTKRPDGNCSDQPLCGGGPPTNTPKSKLAGRAIEDTNGDAYFDATLGKCVSPTANRNDDRRTPPGEDANGDPSTFIALDTPPRKKWFFPHKGGTWGSISADRNKTYTPYMSGFDTSAGMTCTCPVGCKYDGAQAINLQNHDIEDIDFYWTTTPVVKGFSGQVFEDPNGLSSRVNTTSVCTNPSPGAPVAGSEIGGGASVELVETSGFGHSTLSTSPVDSGGNWAITRVDVATSRQLRLTGIDTSKWVCSCPANAGHCQYSTSVTGNPANLHFYLTRLRGTWLQVIGGNVHADADFINPLPASCEADNLAGGSCNPYTILTDTLATPNSDGILTYGDDLDTWDDGGTQRKNVSEGHPDRAANTGTFAKRNDFEHFLTVLEVPQTPQDDFLTGSTNPKNVLQKPSGTGSNDTNPTDDVAVFYSDGNTTQSDAGDWSVTAGEKLIVLVDGNLTIRRNIDVAPGGFLAFVVSGDIRINPNIGRIDPTSTEGAVEGIYIADGSLIVRSQAPNPDIKFVGEGTFVGWSGVNLQRDFRGTDNNTNPAHLFTFRPDFVLNAPEALRRSRITWQEIRP